MGVQLSFPKKRIIIESDAVSSPRRQQQSEKNENDFKQHQKHFAFVTEQNAKNKKNLTNEDNGNDDFHSYYDHSVNVTHCSQVQIGTRNEVVYHFASSASPPNFKETFPQEQFYQDFEFTSKESQNRRGPDNSHDDESPYPESSEIETESHSISPKLQDAFKMLTEVVTEGDILELKDHIGKGWRKMASSLGYSKGQMDQFKENYPTIDEVIYKLLLDWKRVNVNEASVSVLAYALYDAGEIEAAERIGLMHTLN